ncbi:MAG TPA: hypothetical protein P5055_14305, partial [Candidatus Paceibacterota bacterium]|nr:hypothetical protein [Candidatus Paceibacterota bacterium]
MLEIHLSNKRRPQDMLLIMRRKEEALDCRLAELTRDYIRCEREIDFSLKKKTDVILKGHNLEKRLADTELKALYRQISDLRCAISCATKARAFFSLARLKLERHSGAKRKTAWNNFHTLPPMQSAQSGTRFCPSFVRAAQRVDLSKSRSRAGRSLTILTLSRTQSGPSLGAGRAETVDLGLVLVGFVFLAQLRGQGLKHTIHREPIGVVR